MASEIIGTGVAFPLRVDRRGGLALVRGGEDVDEAIQLILGTAPGERPMRPQFGCGIHNLVFETIDAAMVARVEREIRAAIDHWEPRVEILDIRVDVSRRGEGELVIEIDYVLRATNDVRNLVYPFYVIPEEPE